MPTSNLHDQTVDLAALLGRTPLFKNIPADQLTALTAQSKTRPMRNGDVLFRRGDVGTAMLVILAGQVRIVLPGVDGREHVVRVLQAGEALGELALLDGRQRTADAVADTNGRLLVVERRDMMAAMRSQPDLALSMLTMLTDRLRTTNWLLESMLFHDAAARLAATLLLLSAGQPGRRVNITQGALGERVGVTRETVNRRLREWQSAGVIALEPGGVVVLDRAALSRHAPPTDAAGGDDPQLW